jgi:hypothetical protein
MGLLSTIVLIHTGSVEIGSQIKQDAEVNKVKHALRITYKLSTESGKEKWTQNLEYK